MPDRSFVVDDTQVAELASLLEIEVADARAALSKARGDFGAAIDVVRTGSAESRPSTATPAAPKNQQFDDIQVAELASLLELEVCDARNALIETKGDFNAAIDLVRSRCAPSVSLDNGRAEPVIPEEQRYEWDGGGSSVLTVRFDHRVIHEPALRDADGAGELKALEQGVPARDFLPNLCDVSRVRTQRSLAMEAIACMDRSNTSGVDLSGLSIGDVSLHSERSFALGSLEGPREGPEREMAILEGNARLQKRLERCGLRAMLVDDDGNCLFRACAAQLYRDIGGMHHPLVRHRAVAEMHKHASRYAPYFHTEEEFASYLAEMAVLGTWGDELVLRAIADAYRTTVHVVTSTEDNWYLRYEPEAEDVTKASEASAEPKKARCRNAFLTYLSPVHYNGFELKPLEPSDVQVQVKGSKQ